MLLGGLTMARKTGSARLKVAHARLLERLRVAERAWDRSGETAEEFRRSAEVATDHAVYLRGQVAEAQKVNEDLYQRWIAESRKNAVWERRFREMTTPGTDNHATADVAHTGRRVEDVTAGPADQSSTQPGETPKENE